MLADMSPSDLENRHMGWIAAWGIVVLVIAALAGTVASKASSPFSGTIWLILAIFCVVGVFALYMTFSPLLGKWPFRDSAATFNGVLQRPFLPASFPISGSPTVSGDPNDVGRTPQEIWDLFNGLTDLQAERVTEPLLGRLLTVMGKVESVSSVGYGMERTMVTVYPRMFHSVALFFDDKIWLPRLSALKKGDHIAARGNISSIGRMNMHIDDCELL